MPFSLPKWMEGVVFMLVVWALNVCVCIHVCILKGKLAYFGPVGLCVHFLHSTTLHAFQCNQMDTFIPPRQYMYSSGRPFFRTMQKQFQESAHMLSF